MTEEELAKIERRANAATAGPWVVDEQYIRSDNEKVREEDGWICQWQAYGKRANASFIAAARTDVVRLAAALRAAWKERS
jgi:hypothetical protein